MSKDLEEVKNLVDSLLIEAALNTAHLKTLTIAFHELSGHLLKPDEAKNFQSHYYNKLYENSSELLNSPDMLYNHSKVTKALFELHSFVQHQLKDLEKE